MSTFRKKTTNALGWDLLGSYGGQICAFLISIVLARLLDPAEFGLVGMSMVFIAVLQIFKDMGFASALVQNKHNTALTYSSIFYLNVFAGAVLTALLYFLAPYIGSFYDNEQVTGLVRLLSITFFISSFNIVQSTILRKELNFKALTYRDLISQVIAGVVAIIFAIRGFGVYSLVIQLIVAAVLQTILLWKISGWYPSLQFSWAEVKKLSGFSVYVFAAQSVNQIIRQADVLIIGKLFSPATLGFFSRANSLNYMITKNSSGSLSKVFFPALSTIQDDDQRFQKVFLKVIRIVSALSVFLTGALFLVGEELIIGLYGEKWEPSVLIFQILIITGFTYPISAMIVNAFMAKGKSRQNFHYGNIRKVLQLCPMLVAYFYGFEPFLYSIIVVAILAWLLNNIFASISLNISFGKQVMAVFPNLLFAAVLVFLVQWIFPKERNYLLAGLELAVFCIGFLMFLIVTRSEVIGEAKIIFQKLGGKINNKST